jgi:hypothetical protein
MYSDVSAKLQDMVEADEDLVLDLKQTGIAV